MRDRDLAAFDIRVLRPGDMTADDRTRVFALFDAAYRQANHAYLEKSFGTLPHLSIAMHAAEPAGFALADMRVLDLPRLPGQVVAMAGICCIAARFRRHGLFGALERAAMAAAGIVPVGRMINAGRMAHPASYRTMARSAAAVPGRGNVPSPWHQQVGAAIAAAYGVADFDPKTFVCHGAGVPIGYPDMDLDVTPEEWDVFAPVDRDRGDSLLGISWTPDAPDGW